MQVVTVERRQKKEDPRPGWLLEAAEDAIANVLRAGSLCLEMGNTAEAADWYVLYEKLRAKRATLPGGSDWKPA